jgi:hypothetical protein
MTNRGPTKPIWFDDDRVAGGGKKKRTQKTKKTKRLFDSLGFRRLLLTVIRESNKDAAYCVGACRCRGGVGAIRSRSS